MIAWSTADPYEAALQCEAPGLAVEGFAIKCGRFVVRRPALASA